MKHFALLAAIAVGLLLSGCAGQATQTPAQIASQFCAPIQDAISLLSTSPLLTTTDQQKLDTDVNPLVNAVCTAGATVNVANLKALVATGFPAINGIVQASTLSDDKKSQIGTDITAAQLLITLLMSQLPAGTAPAIPAQ